MLCLCEPGELDIGLDPALQDGGVTTWLAMLMTDSAAQPVEEQREKHLHRHPELDKLAIFPNNHM